MKYSPNSSNSWPTANDPPDRDHHRARSSHPRRAGRLGTAASLDQLISECAALDDFRRSSPNLYERVRALFFLYAIHRFHIPTRLTAGSHGHVPFDGYNHLLARRFEEAIDVFLAHQKQDGPSDAISKRIGRRVQRTRVRHTRQSSPRSVRPVRGNQWMFRVGHPADQPLRIRPELLARSSTGLFPVLTEKTPVRMDLSHSAWSDIFFLGMDFPEGRAGSKCLD